MFVSILIQKTGMELLDVIIVGGGPAGLNAAVVLGRCRRSVLLFDVGQQRNKASHGMHNYLTRDDILPTDFLQICQGELKKYGVRTMRRKVVRAKKTQEDLFEVRDDEGTLYFS